MPGTAHYEALCAALASAPGMDRWTARGALQLALMDAGLESQSVSAEQLGLVIEHVLPRQLESHGGLDVRSVCARLRDVLALSAGALPGDSA